MSKSLGHHRLYNPWKSPGHNTGVGGPSLRQAIFPTQGLNPGVPHCRQTLYQLSHKGSPRILERVAYPFSSGSSWPRNWTGVSYIVGGFFTNWAMREAQRVKNLPTMQENQGSIPGSGRLLEKEKATNSSILAWEIPWTEETSGLQSMRSQKLDTTEQLSTCVTYESC